MVSDYSSLSKERVFDKLRVVQVTFWDSIIEIIPLTYRRRTSGAIILGLADSTGIVVPLMPCSCRIYVSMDYCKVILTADHSSHFSFVGGLLGRSHLSLTPFQ